MVFHVINLNGAVLEWASRIKYLQIISDNKLTFEHQILSVCQKLNTTQGALQAPSCKLISKSIPAIYYALL